MNPSATDCADEILRIPTHTHVRIGDDDPPEPGVVAGSRWAVADRLAGLVKLGFTARSASLRSGPHRTEQAERLAREVIAAVRGALALGAGVPAELCSTSTGWTDRVRPNMSPGRDPVPR